MMRDEKNNREKEEEDLDLVVSGKIKEPLKRSEVKGKSLSHVCLFATPRTIQSIEFSRPEYWSR